MAVPWSIFVDTGGATARNASAISARGQDKGIKAGEYFGGSAVVVGHLLEASAFGPEAIDCMVEAYEAALAKLGLANSDDAATRLLAEKIIEITQNGERDPMRISKRAIEELGTPPTVNEKLAPSGR